MKHTNRIGDFSYPEPGKKPERISPAQSKQAQSLKAKQELIRQVSAHMNACNVCQTYGHHRCRALKELQDNFPS